MWVSAKCYTCGWTTDRMMKSKAVNGQCPYCNSKDLHPR